MLCRCVDKFGQKIIIITIIIIQFSFIYFGISVIFLANELSEKKEFNEAVVNYKLAADEDKKDI